MDPEGIEFKFYLRPFHTKVCFWVKKVTYLQPASSKDSFNKGPTSSVRSSNEKVPESPRHKENPYPFEKQTSLDVKRIVPVQEIVNNRMSAASEPEPAHLRVGESSEERGRGECIANCFPLLLLFAIFSFPCKNIC